MGSDQHLPGGMATFASTRGTLTRIDCIAAPAIMLARLILCRFLVKSGIPWQVIRSIRRHDHSPAIAVFQNHAELEQVKEEPTWSVEAINAWTNGWKRPEVIGAIVKALEENKAKFDHFVDNVKTADARLFGPKKGNGKTSLPMNTAPNISLGYQISRFV